MRRLIGAAFFFALMCSMSCSSANNSNSNNGECGKSADNPCYSSSGCGGS